MRVVTIVTLVMCGCGGSDDPKPASDQPAAFVQSNTADPSTVHAANLGCLGTRIDPEAPATVTMLNVHVKDFEKKTDVEGATVEVYTSLARFNARTPDATSGVTDASGHALLMMPAGAYRVIFRTTGDPGLSVETIEFNRAFDDPERYSVSQATKGTIQAVLNVFPDESLGVVAGAVRDCDNKDVGGLLFETASSGGAYDSAHNTFYFTDAGASTVPDKRQKWTSGNGVFSSLNVPPGDATVTARGLVSSGAALQVIGTGVIPVRANSITVVQLDPLGPSH